MPSAFVPFLPSGGKFAAAPVTASNGATDTAAAATAFAAILPNRSDVNPATANPAACAHAPNNGTAAKPVVSLQKDGDRVTHIRIQCGCGEVIELDCAY